MILTPFTERYDDNTLGHMVIMMSLEGVWDLMPMTGLMLDSPSVLREICSKATEAVPAAHYDDEDVMGWVRHAHLVGQAFRADPLREMSARDLHAFHDWLENGNPGTVHVFPYRTIWKDACLWAAREGELAEWVESPALDKMQAFAGDLLKVLKDPEYEAAKQALAQNQDSYFDTYQKTKFHINIVPDVMICQPLIIFNQMRRSHLMMDAMQRYVRKDGDLSVLDRMVRVYAEHKVTSRWMKPYIQDPKALAASKLWSDTFREDLHEVY